MKRIIKNLTFCLSIILALQLVVISKANAAETGYWIEKNNKWYYYDNSGCMFTDNIFFDKDDKEYYVDKNGVMQTGWIFRGGEWNYFYGNGEMAKNTVIDGYIINSDGIWVDENGKVLDKPTAKAPGNGTLIAEFDNIEFFEDGNTLQGWIYSQGVWTLGVKEEHSDGGIGVDIEDHTLTALFSVPKDKEYTIVTKYHNHIRNSNDKFHITIYKGWETKELLFSVDV